MGKVVKAFSLDRRTVDILENYCRKSDNWKKNISRSKVVNDAIVWFLSDSDEFDRAELVHNNEMLVEAVQRANQQLAQRANQQLANPTKQKSWWRQILGF